MNNYDTDFTISNIQNGIDSVKESLEQLLKVIQAEQDMWDNSEMIRRWKVSERTLASWRCKGLIDFVQAGSKIWYPREAREKFLREHKVENHNHEEANYGN